MEFIKHGKNYIIKNSNGRIVTEKEKLELENKELVLKDIASCDCQKETTNDSFRNCNCYCKRNGTSCKACRCR